MVTEYSHPVEFFLSPGSFFDGVGLYAFDFDLSEGSQVVGDMAYNNYPVENMLDVDDFKQFNDKFGHAAGDLILRELGDLLLSHFRGEDIDCRYVGNEFIIVLVEASLEMTRERATRLC